MGGSEGASTEPVLPVSNRLEIRPEALADIGEAAAWYEERQRGLGERFTAEIVAAIDALLTNPLICRLRNRRLGVRWRFPPSFPYRIVYLCKEDVVTVVAVIHAARRDKHWRERLKP